MWRTNNSSASRRSKDVVRLLSQSAEENASHAINWYMLCEMLVFHAAKRIRAFLNCPSRFPFEQTQPKDIIGWNAGRFSTPKGQSFQIPLTYPPEISGEGPGEVAR
jgi:hypothetical protein